MTIDKLVVPYIGTWIETENENKMVDAINVVPYIGTWIETSLVISDRFLI